ncbi:hypothetical protein RJ639_027101 [Escallonia herrerae]|uniref:Cytochrome P450 n=1 Tax=Escallonia herrerae TaxID=1293975 RepID=A0AA88XAE3_9ASTE|nr:hypothetical protein RJ639_027101 [Escallonia herrerae]
MRIQFLMGSQGIRGPSYRFIYGNTKEISSMREKSMGGPMELSHHIFPRLQPHLHSWFKLYGMIFLQWHGATAELVVTDPEFVKEILNNRERYYPKPEADVFTKKITGDGLLASKGEKWTKLRKLANHAFHAESLKSMIPAMIESAEVMLEGWKKYEGKEIEVHEEFRMLTSEVISRTAFGSSYLEGEDIFQMLRKLSLIAGRNDYNIRLPGISRIFKSSDDKESDKLEKHIRDSFLEIIRKRQKSMNEEGSNGMDFLGLLLKAGVDTQEISVEGIIDECKTFYAAGHGTTTLLLSWAILLLAINTDWQEKARQEVLKVLGCGRPNSEGISRLKLMGMIISETLRLYPPAVALTRKVQREVRLQNLILPANMNLNIPALALHHDSKIWGEDAHLFKPERFSEGVAKATNNRPSAYIPFGLGPRACVGSSFAIDEVKIVLAMILQRYAFTLSPNYIHSPIQVIAIRPKHGVQVALHAL